MLFTRSRAITAVLLMCVTMLCTDHAVSQQAPKRVSNQSTTSSSKLIDPYQGEAVAIERANELESRTEKRLGDIWGVVNLLGYIAGLLGVLITITVLYFSIRSTKSAVAEAKNEARDFLEEWMRVHGERLLQQEIMRAIEPHLTKALQEIKDKSTAALVELDNQLNKTAQLSQTLEALSATKQGVLESAVEELPASGEATAAIVDQPVEEPLPIQTPQRPKTKKAEVREAAALRDTSPAEAIAKLEALASVLQVSALEDDIAASIEAQIELAVTYEKLENYKKVAEIYEALMARHASTGSKKIAHSLSRAASLASRFFEDQADYARVYQIVDSFIPMAIRLQLTGLPLNRALNCLSAKSRSQFAQNDYEGVLNTHEQIAPLIPADAVGFLPIRSVLTNLDLRKARALVKLSRTTEAKKFMLDLLNTPTDRTPGREDRSRTHRLEFTLATIYEAERNYPEALAYFRRIIELPYEGSARTYKLQALLHKAAILSELKLRDEELSTYDTILSLWKADPSEFLSAYAAAALVNKAIALSQMEQSQKALAVANEALQLFSPSTDPEVIEQTTKAARLKALLER